MGQNLLTANTNATSAQVSALSESVAALPTASSLATQSNVAIKSIQRGQTSFPSNAYAYVGISSVNTQKTELRILGYMVQGMSAVGQSQGAFINLLDSTTLKIYGASNNSGTGVMSWELTEFY